MPTLDAPNESQNVKALYIGDSGTGKTGSLVSLVADGYELRIIDADNGLGALRKQIAHICPDKAKNVSYVQAFDNYGYNPALGVGVKGTPKAFTEILKYLDKWEDGSNPAEWGPQKILVIDSLSTVGLAAFEFARGLNPLAKDPRQWYGTAQAAIERMLAALASKHFNTNVIVISHINYYEITEGITKGYVNSIGNALGPKIPRYYDILIAAETIGVGKALKRVIKISPTALLDLKNPDSFKFNQDLPLETGMSTLFKQMKGK